jgi:H+-translocating NAD(P) transhydrogenase subunit alpha
MEIFNMKFVVPKETNPEETRVAMIPASIEKLAKKGVEICVENGLGEKIGFTDEDYVKAGAKIENDRTAMLSSADIVLGLLPLPQQEVKLLKKGSIYIGYVDPFNNESLVELFVNQGVSLISVEKIPRTTLAQKMDVLSSQSNIGGYAAVIFAAEKFDRVFPMMMTPAGTLAPAHIFIVGAGVAGLQAIATAKRLGARVEAFDVRPEAAEQIKSLGAKAIKIDVGDTSSTNDGYAKKLTPEQIEKQRQGMAKVCSHADIIITTAQVFGGKAPLIITDDMIKGMKPGSIIIDMAAGNVEGSKNNEEIDIHGVRVIADTNLARRLPLHSSQMYSANLANMIDEYWSEEEKTFHLNLDDEIIAGSLITHNNQRRS